ncbi:MFS transporter [Salibacterium halotolerans]|uniref:Predicted arabinose efflux permease, MFS family n=1 Tax=Salibacterium halotolerans TaxID=1884432 RepID=A0A1I5RLW6_9BACI|nr:MFS transporter [Salibacterium halotolerans]SFP58906.1 Predicted arabinose efflux permease, MFS family [Salibacterium halotolerans]
MKLDFPRSVILAVFMLGTFAVGMTEYVVTGLLTQFAEGLDVKVSTTGVLLSVYAISVAVFGPLLRMVTIKYSPKPLLLVFISIFIISNIIAAAAPTFEILVLSRLFSAAMHAPFFGLCMSLAVQMSAPEKRTQAIASVQGGLTIAIMLGVPFGSFIGGALDWRLVFWFIALLGVLTFIGLAVVTPNVKPSSTPQLKKELAGMLKNKSVLMVIAIIVFGFSGVFTAYTFTEPMLRQFAGFDVTGVTTGLFFFGLGAVAGNFASGRIHPERLTERLIVFLAVLGGIVALFTFLLEFSVLAFIMCFLFGAGTFGTTPILNSKIIIASPDSPSMSGTVAASVFNLANSIGATLGTVFLDAGFPYVMITFIAAGIIFFGMILTIITHLVEDKSLFQSHTDA